MTGYLILERPNFPVDLTLIVVIQLAGRLERFRGGIARPSSDRLNHFLQAMFGCPLLTLVIFSRNFILRKIDFEITKSGQVRLFFNLKID